MRHVLGIVGLKRSGKDTFARVVHSVANERSYAFISVAFADSLREAGVAAYGVDIEAFTDDTRKDTVCPEWDITYRQMLINLGMPATLLGGDHDHWVKRWRIEVNRRQRDLDRLIVAVPDVRRLNEAAAVHDASGINVLVQRPGVEWNGHGTEELAQKIGQHPTLCYAAEALSGLHTGHWHPRSGELYLRSVVDAVVDNDGDVAALRPHAERVFDMLTKEKK